MDQIIPTLYAEARAMSGQLSAWRRDLHRRPEPSYEERETAAYIESALRAMDIPFRRVGETAVLASLRFARPGRTVAMRADIDALRVQEAVAREYGSQVPGVMHACGHDGHVACLLGAAALLSRHRQQLAGQVNLLFQPAEEMGGGAHELMAAGALEGVERIFGLHCAPDLPAGTVGLTPGLNNASVDHFTIRVKGRSSHVSAPQQGIDALYIASHIVVALQSLVTRMTSPVQPLLIGVGTLHAGTTYNALAESAVLEGTTRAVSVESRRWAKEKVDETARTVAALYGGSAEILWEDFGAPLINDPAATAEAARVADEMLGPGHVVSDRSLSMSGDNFADYLLCVPGVYAYLGTSCQADPCTQESIHSTSFDLDESALPIGAALGAGCAARWLKAETL